MIVVYSFYIFRQLPPDIPIDKIGEWYELRQEEEERIEEWERNNQQNLDTFLQKLEERKKTRQNFINTPVQDMDAFNDAFLSLSNVECEFITNADLKYQCETLILSQDSDMKTVRAAILTNNIKQCLNVDDEIKRILCKRIIALKEEKEFLQQELANREQGIYTISQQESIDRQEYLDALSFDDSSFCYNILDDSLKNDCIEIFT